MSRSLRLHSLVSLLPLFAFGSMSPAPAAAARGGVAICHRAGPKMFITLHVSENAVSQHVGAHEGDYPAACGTIPPGGDT